MELAPRHLVPGVARTGDERPSPGTAKSPQGFGHPSAARMGSLAWQGVRRLISVLWVHFDGVW